MLMESSDGCLILFHISLHYIDTAADLRSKSDFEFDTFIAFVLNVCFHNGVALVGGYM